MIVTQGSGVLRQAAELIARSGMRPWPVPARIEIPHVDGEQLALVAMRQLSQADLATLVLGSEEERFGVLISDHRLLAADRLLDELTVAMISMGLPVQQEEDA